MKAVVVSVAVTLVVATSGCTGPLSSQASDCPSQVRADGIVYTSHGYTKQEATKYSSAEDADCDDVGAGARGSFFPESPRQVTTWTFANYPSTAVIGVVRPERPNFFAVYIADATSRAERDRIYDDLIRGR